MWGKFFSLFSLKERTIFFVMNISYGWRNKRFRGMHLECRNEFVQRSDSASLFLCFHFPPCRRRAWQTQASDRAGGRHQGRRRKEEQADKVRQSNKTRHKADCFCLKAWMICEEVRLRPNQIPAEISLVRKHENISLHQMERGESLSTLKLKHSRLQVILHVV